MSYSISISGHREPKNDADAERFNRRVEREARKFVKALEGVSGATLSDSRGSTDLLAKPVKAAKAAK